MDLFPTAAELMNADLPAGRTLDGRSWLPLLRDPAAPGHDALYFEWDAQLAVRQGPWKLVKNGLIDQRRSRTNRAKGDDALFLANLDQDPAEQTNLRNQHPDLADQLLKQHRTWRTSLDK